MHDIVPKLAAIPFGYLGTFLIIIITSPTIEGHVTHVVKISCYTLGISNGVK